MLSLRYKPIWIFASMVLVLGVIWGSLQTAFGGAVPGRLPTFMCGAQQRQLFARAQSLRVP